MYKIIVIVVVCGLASLVEFVDPFVRLDPFKFALMFFTFFLSWNQFS